MRAKWPNGRILRVVVSPYATPGGLLCETETGLIKFFAHEPAPCEKPNFRESVAGMDYSEQQKDQLIETQDAEEKAWDAEHPEWIKWRDSQPRI
jgi:hypothetical protein